MKKRVIYLLLIIIAFTTCYKASYSYNTFNENNIPVYDGVMYEKNQIRAYFQYKDNFSLKERINQVIYEFQRNPINPGFNCVIALINPKWFINDYDIMIRSFLATFIFSLVLVRFLRNRTSDINKLLIIALIFQLPLFYHYRYGLGTYVPEISSALFLLSGYLLILIFFSTEKKWQLMIGLVLMSISIMFRFNFFVYASALLLPLFYSSISILRKKGKWELIYFSSFGLLLLGFVFVYVLSKLSFFLGYYNHPVPYQKFYLKNCLIGIIDDWRVDIGLIGLLVFLIVWILSNEEKLTNQKKMTNFYLCYPYLFFIGFIYLYINATNTPHVAAAVMVFIFPIFIIPSKLLNFIYTKLNRRVLQIASIIIIVFLNVNFFTSCKKLETISDEYKVPKKVINDIIQIKNLDEGFKYFCFFEEMEEYPIDVAVHKKTGVWLGTKDVFYFHDSGFYGISKDLDTKTCTNFYIDKILEGKHDLIAINKTANIPMKGQKNAILISRNIRKFIVHNKNYKKVKTILNLYHGEVEFYKRKGSKY